MRRLKGYTRTRASAGGEMNAAPTPEDGRVGLEIHLLVRRNRTAAGPQSRCRRERAAHSWCALVRAVAAREERSR